MQLQTRRIVPVLAELPRLRKKIVVSRSLVKTAALKQPIQAWRGSIHRAISKLMRVVVNRPAVSAAWYSSVPRTILFKRSTNLHPVPGNCTHDLLGRFELRIRVREKQATPDLHAQ
jgi:hypothetical protein